MASISVHLAGENDFSREKIIVRRYCSSPDRRRKGPCFCDNIGFGRFPGNSYTSPRAHFLQQFGLTLRRQSQLLNLTSLNSLGNIVRDQAGHRTVNPPPPHQADPRSTKFTTVSQMLHAPTPFPGPPRLLGPCPSQRILRVCLAPSFATNSVSTGAHARSTTPTT